MSVLLRNKTTFLSTVWLQEALNVVCPWYLHDEFEAVFWEGKTNEGISSPLGYIEMTVNENTEFPHAGPKHGEYRGVLSYTFEELLVWLIAHETRHQFQDFHDHIFPRHCPKAPGIEKDAEEFGQRALNAYRRGALVIPGRATKEWIPRPPGRPVFLPTAEAWQP